MRPISKAASCWSISGSPTGSAGAARRSWGGRCATSPARTPRCRRGPPPASCAKCHGLSSCVLTHCGDAEGGGHRRVSAAPQQFWGPDCADQFGSGDRSSTGSRISIGCWISVSSSGTNTMRMPQPAWTVMRRPKSVQESSCSSTWMTGSPSGPPSSIWQRRTSPRGTHW